MILLMVVLYAILASSTRCDIRDGTAVMGYKGKAIYLLSRKAHSKRLFPDFYTFAAMGFNETKIVRMKDAELASVPEGKPIERIAAPAVFRGEDFMFHTQCEDPDRMVNDLGLVPHMGSYIRYVNTHRRIKKKGRIEILALGGSITAGGYFMEFKRLLQEESGLDVMVRNHGHGATEITYTLFCVDINKYRPDLVLIEFAVNDYGHPKLMDALIRKVLSLPSRPIVLLANLWVSKECPATRYLLHAFYYDIPVLNVCPAVNLCFGKGHLPKWQWEQYSKTDGVHPWGVRGVSFLGGIMYSWWTRYESLLSGTSSFWVDLSRSQNGGNKDLENISYDMEESDDKNMTTGFSNLPLVPVRPLYVTAPLGACTRCDTLTDDADARLRPVGHPKGFRIVTRVKVGFGGFGGVAWEGGDGYNASMMLTGGGAPIDEDDEHSAAATAATAAKRSYGVSGGDGNGGGQKPVKSSKRSWQAEKAGSTISFSFFGSSVKIAIWQRRDGMGILHATVDGDTSRVAKASGFFQGYTWAMERNNTGRSEIISLFEGLPDTRHILTLTVSQEPANKWVPGHLVQIFALLSASDNSRRCNGKDKKTAFAPSSSATTKRVGVRGKGILERVV